MKPMHIVAAFHSSMSANYHRIAADVAVAVDCPDYVQMVRHRTLHDVVELIQLGDWDHNDQVFFSSATEYLQKIN